MDITKDLDLLKRYFKNKESEGIVTLNGHDVLGAFTRLRVAIELQQLSCQKKKHMD